MLFAPRFLLCVDVKFNRLRRAESLYFDSNRDGRSDIWKIAYEAQDLSPDKDGDGVTNVQECLHGSDPSDADSKLVLIELDNSYSGVEEYCHER